MHIKWNHFIFLLIQLYFLSLIIYSKKKKKESVNFTETSRCVPVAVACMFCLRQSVKAAAPSLKSPSHLTRDATRVPQAAGGATRLPVHMTTRPHSTSRPLVLRPETSSIFNDHNFRYTDTRIPVSVLTQIPIPISVLRLGRSTLPVLTN